jgi:hypothetical protein
MVEDHFYQIIFKSCCKKKKTIAWGEGGYFYRGVVGPFILTIKQKQTNHENLFKKKVILWGVTVIICTVNETKLLKKCVHPGFFFFFFS